VSTQSSECKASTQSEIAKSQPQSQISKSQVKDQNAKSRVPNVRPTLIQNLQRLTERHKWDTSDSKKTAIDLISTSIKPRSLFATQIYGVQMSGTKIFNLKAIGHSSAPPLPPLSPLTIDVIVRLRLF
jgi:hypothetical protein